jgi:hypothetical protein
LIPVLSAALLRSAMAGSLDPAASLLGLAPTPVGAAAPPCFGNLSELVQATAAKALAMTMNVTPAFILLLWVVARRAKTCFD